MINPLVKEIERLEEEVDKLCSDDEEDFEEAYKTVLIAIKDFCHDCQLQNKECHLCFLGEHRERAQAVYTE